MKKKGMVSERIARSGMQAGLVIGLLGLLAALFVLVLAFGGGFVMGTAVERSAAPERCATAGGTWMPETWLCERVTVAPSPSLEGATAYSCGGGTRLTLMGIGTGSIAVDDGSERRVLPKDEARAGRYQDDSYVLTVSGDEADYVDRSTGIGTFCLRSGD